MIKSKSIIHFALEDLFAQLTSKAGKGMEYLVRMSYCELYMERVNDLLRKIGPQSQNLMVKEDPEGRGFYADGLKEKIVSSAQEVLALFAEAEKRRRVAHTRYNEVSSRSHTLLTLTVECSVPLEGDIPDASVTRVGRLVIVDLAGNERLEAGTEYVAESSSINKSLFFLGKVIEKLAARDRRLPGAVDDGDHIPFRDSKLTRLLSVHLGGNSQTGLLVTLTPAEDAVEPSLTTLRFAQKAAEVRCVAKPVLISKEQSLIVKQREIIQQLHSQVRSLQEEVQRSTSTLPRNEEREEELAAEREQCAQQLQALVLSSSEGNQSFVSKSREVDTVVTALHRNMDVLKKQKSMVVESMKGLYKTVNEVTAAVAQASDLVAAGDFHGACEVLGNAGTLEESSAWAPGILELRQKLQMLKHEHWQFYRSAGWMAAYLRGHRLLRPLATSIKNPSEAMANEWNERRFAEVQQAVGTELQQSERELAEIEEQEAEALSRLSHSQSVRYGLSPRQAPASPAPSSRRPSAPPEAEVAAVDDLLGPVAGRQGSKASLGVSAASPPRPASAPSAGSEPAPAGRQGSIASLGAVSAASLPAQPVASVPSGSVREVSVEEASLGPVAGRQGSIASLGAVSAASPPPASAPSLGSVRCEAPEEAPAAGGSKASRVSMASRGSMVSVGVADLGVEDLPLAAELDPRHVRSEPVIDMPAARSLAAGIRY
ncbi:unnamed protein product [Effrenium voratum]|nr:unnamed protein product [Effrenium voratum]